MSDTIACGGVTRVKIKSGELFDQPLVIPADFADGYFAGAALFGAVCDRAGVKVADLACTWADPVTTREIRMVGPTESWPVGRILYSDVLIHRDASAGVDAIRKYTQTIRIRVSPSFAKQV